MEPKFRRSSRNHKRQGPADRELQWLAAHPEVFSLYHEQWIAIVKESVIAHGKDLALVAAQARETARRPLYFLVPSKALQSL